MFDKERLLKVSGLNSSKIEQMDDSHVNYFTIAANSFIDDFPALEDSVKKALKAKELGALVKALTVVNDMLRRIYAEKLAGMCSSHLIKPEDIKYEDLQAFVNDFLKAVSTLSVDLQMAAYQDPQPSLPNNDRKPTAKNTILAVDDLHIFLNSIKAKLHNTGYKVTCINSGTSALRYLKIHRPALFILDIEMPGMDGYELAHKIRESGQTAPIIFLTGNSRKDSVIRALRAGAADFLVKPVTKAELLGRIGKYIEPDLTEPQSEWPESTDSEFTWEDE
ncbi:MAG: response regulator [Leptospirales bacterium]|nr:response regulator [Leptospirales bacterium]